MKGGEAPSSTVQPAGSVTSQCVRRLWQACAQAPGPGRLLRALAAAIAVAAVAAIIAAAGAAMSGDSGARLVRALPHYAASALTAGWIAAALAALHLRSLARAPAPVGAAIRTAAHLCAPPVLWLAAMHAGSWFEWQVRRTPIAWGTDWFYAEMYNEYLREPGGLVLNRKGSEREPSTLLRTEHRKGIGVKTTIQKPKSCESVSLRSPEPTTAWVLRRATKVGVILGAVWLSPQTVGQSLDAAQVRMATATSATARSDTGGPQDAVPSSFLVDLGPFEEDLQALAVGSGDGPPLIGLHRPAPHAFSGDLVPEITWSSAHADESTRGAFTVCSRGAASIRVRVAARLPDAAVVTVFDGDGGSPREPWTGAEIGEDGTDGAWLPSQDGECVVVEVTLAHAGEAETASLWLRNVAHRFTGDELETARAAAKRAERTGARKARKLQHRGTQACTDHNAPPAMSRCVNALSRSRWWPLMRRPSPTTTPNRRAGASCARARSSTTAGTTARHATPCSSRPPTA